MGQERMLSSKYHWHAKVIFRKNIVFLVRDFRVRVYANFYNDQSREGLSVPLVIQKNDND